MPAKKEAAKKKVTAPAPEVPKTKEIEVTQEYLDANPEMKANGIAVGDIIEVDADESDVPPAKQEEKPAPKAVKGAIAILKNGTEYIRTYAADQADAAQELVSKDSAYSMVPDESIVELEVPYQVKDAKTGTVTHTEKRFTNKADALVFRNMHRSICKVVPAKKG